MTAPTFQLEAARECYVTPNREAYLDDRMSAIVSADVYPVDTDDVITVSVHVYGSGRITSPTIETGDTDPDHISRLVQAVGETPDLFAAMRDCGLEAIARERERLIEAADTFRAKQEIQ